MYVIFEKDFKMIYWNLPVTTDKRDLLTRLKENAVSWEVRLDDCLGGGSFASICAGSIPLTSQYP